MKIKSLEVTVISANGLKNLKNLNTMDPYAMVYLSGGNSLPGGDEHRTSVDKNGGTTPHWVDSVAFPLDEAAARAGDLFLVFKIMTKKVGRSDQKVASAEMPVNELLVLLEQQGDGNPAAMSHSVRLQPQGELKFRYKFSEAPPAARAADQERPKKISGRAVLRICLCMGQIADFIADASDG